MYLYIIRLVIGMTSWPSGLRRNVKAVVFIGVGSNPTDVSFFFSSNHMTYPAHYHSFIAHLCLRLSFLQIT